MTTDQTTIAVTIGLSLLFALAAWKARVERSALDEEIERLELRRAVEREEKRRNPTKTK